MPIEKKRRNALLLCVSLSVVWGLGYIFVPMALNAGATPSLVVFSRFFIAAVVYGIIFARKVKITSKDLPFGILSGLLLAVSFGLQTFGQNLTTPSNSAFITSLMTVFVPFISWIFFKKKPSYLLYISLIVYTVGMLILSYQGGSFMLNLGDILTLLCALGFAFHFIVLVFALQRSGTETLNFLQFITASVVLGIFFAAYELPAQMEAAINWPMLITPIVCLALFSTVYAYSVQTYSQRLLPPYQVSIILSLENVFGSMFSLMFGYEVFGWNIVIGGLLIFGSVVIAQITPVTERKVVVQNVDVVKE
jgi:drug/metabolite transporter (DMT)-like permease